MEWFSSLVWFEKIFWITSIIGSILFLIMMVMTFIGGVDDVDGDMDSDFDADGGGFHFFTIKNLIAFFTIFGWSGIAALDYFPDNRIAVVGIATFCGILMMIIMATLFYLISKLNDSGTLDIKNAVGSTGDVYLTIGAKRASIGKVNVRIQGALRELEALTDEIEDLKTGTVIEVLDVTNNGILIVQKPKSN
jgi:hypothetical protein